MNTNIQACVVQFTQNQNEAIISFTSIKKSLPRPQELQVT